MKFVIFTLSLVVTLTTSASEFTITVPNGFVKAFELDQNKVNTEGCLKEFVINYDNVLEILELSAELDDGSLVTYADYYFTQINSQPFQSFYTSPTGASFESLEQNILIQYESTLSLISTVANSNASAPYRQLSMVIKDGSAQIHETEHTTDPLTERNCYYLEK